MPSWKETTPTDWAFVVFVTGALASTFVKHKLVLWCAIVGITLAVVYILSALDAHR